MCVCSGNQSDSKPRSSTSLASAAGSTASSVGNIAMPNFILGPSSDSGTLMPEYHELPSNLPVPEDDGAADHLPGAAVPPLRLALADGGEVDLAQAATGTLVAFVYPRTGTPGVPP